MKKKQELGRIYLCGLPFRLNKKPQNGLFLKTQKVSGLCSAQHAQEICPSLASAAFKITANRLTTVFLLLQMKNIRKPGEYSAFQFVPTAQCSLQCVFDRADILYCCETGGGDTRVTFLFMVAYALVMISPSRCAYCSSPRALGEQTGVEGTSSSAALLDTTRILTKSNCWKISLSNPQGHCQQRANCIYSSFKQWEIHL